MIKPICAWCGEELDAFGAILLSPPTLEGTVMKYHCCKKCFNKITPTVIKWFEEQIEIFKRDLRVATEYGAGEALENEKLRKQIFNP